MEPNDGISLACSLANNKKFSLPETLSKLTNHFAIIIRSDPKAKEIEIFKTKLNNATTYEDWKDAATNLDRLLHNDKWKQQPKSDIYDYELVQRRTKEIKECRMARDYEKLLFLVRTTLERNLGNICDERLYSTSYTGTKHIIDDYISECELALTTLLDTDNDLNDARILDTLIQTRKAFGRTALVLSGGSVLGLIHTGVMKELLKQKLLPRIISGSSAGSIFASVLCVHFDDEIDELFETLIEKKFDIFEETGHEETIFVRLARFFKHGTMLDNKYLAETLKVLLGNLTFQEAYNRTRKILNVTVSPASIYESDRLLNYLTAPNVLIWSAVCASCSVPFVFASYTLLAKDSLTGEEYPWSPSSLKYIDGSVDNDLPLMRLSELFNVDHFVACQVNPHVVPFVKFNPISSSSWQNTVVDELSHYLLLTSELGLLKNLSTKLRSLLTQQYKGDITIVPDVKISELKDLFKNPTKDTFLEAINRGCRSTWPQLAIIRNHCAIELCLDKCINKLRGRLIPQQKRIAVKDLGRKAFYSTANIKSLNSQPGANRHTLKRQSSAFRATKVTHHVRHKSETIPTNALKLKRKSSQDLATMFNIGSPTHRTMSPSVSRKNSYKNLTMHLGSPAISRRTSISETEKIV